MVDETVYDSTKQPKPIPNNEKPVWDYVIQGLTFDINFGRDHSELIEICEKRKEFGYKKYKTYLQANNGRNAKEDLLQELLDALVYAKQLELENVGVVEFEHIYYQLECILKENLGLLIGE